MKEYKRIIYEPGKVTRIKLNRPQYFNGLSHPLYKELEDAFDRAADDEECRAIIYSGMGPCFSSGHDLLSPEAKPMMADGTTREELIERLGSEEAALDCWWKEHIYYAYEMKMRKWRNIPKLTIAMVHGYCILGAFFNAAMMDIVFASEDALFLPALGQENIGPWDFGPRKTKEVFFEHRFISAREAYECGFVSRIYPSYDILEKETLAYANRVTENRLPSWIQKVKLEINHAMDIHGYSAAMDHAQLVTQQYLRNLPEEELIEWQSFKGKARVPRALLNLTAKLESEKTKPPASSLIVEPGSPKTT